ncbi:MFS transporter [Silvanigrella sp.]|jgi:MFS family permease|uniref:MFS transporter n=1 Tax=Silvanigrella sp. TaxID=2024976 RepID=UPI0037C61144
MKINNQIKSYVASIFISFIEWFEFLVFAYIFVQIFNSTTDLNVTSAFQKIGILLSFFARPIGAFIFGKLSVTKGRIPSLLNTLNLMIISSSLIIIATILKENLYLCAGLAILARLLQGAAIGGEVTTSILYIYEISKNKATAIAFAGLGSALGMGLATYTPALLSGIKSIDNKIYISYGISIALSIAALFIRRSLIETKENNNGVKIKLNKEYFLLSLNIFKYVFPFVFFVYYIFLVFPTYLKDNFNISSEVSEYYLTYFSFFTGIAPIFFGIIADRIGIEKVLKWTIISTILYIPLFIFIKNPIFQINAISLLMSAYFSVGFTKLFTKTTMDNLYLSFPVLYNLIVAIISSQIILLFSLNIDHDVVFIISICLMFIIGIKDVFVSKKNVHSEGKNVYGI